MEKEIERARKIQKLFNKEEEVKARKLRKQEAHEQRSHSSWKFSQIFAAFMGVVLVIMRLLCNPLKRLLSSSQPPSPYKNKDREISCESAAHERKESEKHQQNLERQKNDEIQKQQGQMNVSDFLYLLPITLFQRCISRYLDGGNFEDSVHCLKNAEYFVE